VKFKKPSLRGTECSSCRSQNKLRTEELSNKFTAVDISLSAPGATGATWAMAQLPLGITFDNLTPYREKGRTHRQTEDV
jgi:hypothetical protein